MHQRESNAHQLTFEVAPHPEAGEFIDGSLKISGTFGCRKDLNPGDELTVQIANADGEVIASGLAEVGPVGFAPIKVKNEVIGTERVHKAKLQ